MRCAFSGTGRAHFGTLTEDERRAQGTQQAPAQRTKPRNFVAAARKKTKSLGIMLGAFRMSNFIAISALLDYEQRITNNDGHGRWTKARGQNMLRSLVLLLSIDNGGSFVVAVCIDRNECKMTACENQHKEINDCAESRRVSLEYSLFFYLVAVWVVCSLH